MINNISHRFIFSLVFLAFIVRLSHAQDTEKHELKLLARPLTDSVMLRWAPSTYRLWITGNQYGYLVSRTLVYQNGKIISGSSPQLLTLQPIKPESLDEWEKLADLTDMAGIAAQAIYGSDFDLDAGTPPTGIVDMFSRASVQETKMGFALLAADQDSRVAKYSALSFTDRNADKGCKYLYKVFPAALPEGMVIDTAMFYTGTDEYMPLSAPANLHAAPGDRMVALTWERLGQEGLFSGFFVERSVDNGKTFAALNTSPLINTTPEGNDDSPFHFFVDSLPDNLHDYNYRIRGITPFGEFSPYSRVVIVKGKAQILAAPPMAALFSPDNTTVTIEWEIPQSIDSINTLVRVQRSETHDSLYQIIADAIPVKTRIFIDKQPLTTGYYRLQAYNKESEGPSGSPRLVQLVDNSPPQPPTGLTAVADTTGKVVLRWLPNTEPDIFGYRIFRANSTTEEFSQLTAKPVTDSSFIDKIELRTLTKEVFYSVVAIDKRQNRSDFSATLKLERPDVVPPSPPSFKSIVANGHGINLLWFPSSSTDVAVQHLYRNSENNSPWTHLAKLAPTDSSFSDTTVNETLYSYLLVVADKTGNESEPTKPVAAKYVKVTEQRGWINIKTKTIKDKGVTILRWDTKQSSASSLMLYGKTANNQWRLIKRIANKGDIEIELALGFTEYRIKEITK